MLIILIGISGSGKSTWIAKELKEFDKNNIPESSIEIVCPDDIRLRYFGNITDQSSNVRVWDMAKGMIITCINRSIPCILDATNVSTPYRRDLIDHLPVLYRKIAVLFDVDPAEACKRVRKNIEQKIVRSNVPDSVIYRMYGEYLYTKDIKEEKFEIYNAADFSLSHSYTLDILRRRHSQASAAIDDNKFGL